MSFILSILILLQPNEITPPPSRMTRSGVEVEWSRSTRKLGLTDKLTVRIRVTGSNTIRVIWPKRLLDPDSQSSWGTRLIAETTPKLDKKSARNDYERIYELSPYAAGEAILLQLQPLQIQIEGLAKPLEFTIADPWMIEVTTTIPEPDLALLRPPAPIELPAFHEQKSDWHGPAMLILGTLLVLFGVRIKPRKHRHRPFNEHLLLQYLQRKRKESKFRSIQTDELVESLRKYLVYRLGEGSLSLTSEELGQYQDDPSLQLISHIFVQLDTIRFANAPIENLDGLLTQLCHDLAIPKIRESSESIPITQSSEAR
jgi:hypothetical protein